MIRWLLQWKPGVYQYVRRAKASSQLWGPILSGLVLAGFLMEDSAAETSWDEVGYTHLLDMLGGNAPTGAGISISLVEAQVGLGYLPDMMHAEFTAGADPFSEQITLVDRSQVSSGISSHATSIVGANYFGNTQSMARGANHVTIYEAGDWLKNVLKTVSKTEPGLLSTDEYRVQNFSWISSGNSPLYEEENRDTLLRFDYLVDSNNLTAVVGLNNGNGALPHLFAHSYNAIAVGRTDGNHSAGTTNEFYGPGRSKPDLVAPMGTVSAATAVVSSAATLLHEAVAGTEGAHSEVIKALLLAGATKNEFSNWSHTETQPLDSHWGAGELDIYNSFRMTEGGRGVGSTDATGGQVNAVSTHGWDYQTVQPGAVAEGENTEVHQDLFYNLEIPEGSLGEQLSVLLTWNADVIDQAGGPSFSGEESLANLDLALYDSSTEFLGTLLDESVSDGNNVEHIYQTDLEPGTYTLKVTTDSTHTFGLAWRLDTWFDQPSADYDENGNVDGNDFLTWQRGFGTLVGASHADGDSDGDGDVDLDDLAFLHAALDAPTGFASTGSLPLVMAVPEPGALMLLLGAFFFGVARSVSQCASQ